MAKIIYKRGMKGQNNLLSIKGIEIDLLNGQKALIYPKYAERRMSSNRMNELDAVLETELDALKVKDSYDKTRALLNIESPAVEWISQVSSSAHTLFSLPSLVAAMEIQRQRREIDSLADTIQGADLLEKYTSTVWTCSRFSEYSFWCGSGSYENALHGTACYEYLAVPVLLYKKS